MLKINNGKIYQQWTKSRIVFSEGDIYWHLESQKGNNAFI